ncbi:hypothetical protein [Klebsiella quasivariicola]|nr:hypothetical protein [Klebsiella quasivariicola]
MVFFKAVILVLLSGIVAPLAVYYIKAAFLPETEKKDTTKTD